VQLQKANQQEDVKQNELEQKPNEQNDTQVESVEENDSNPIVQKARKVRLQETMVIVKEPVPKHQVNLISTYYSLLFFAFRIKQIHSTINSHDIRRFQ
jgi:hypothetical protein